MVWKKKKIMMIWTIGRPRGLLIFSKNKNENESCEVFFVRLTYENSGLNFKFFLEKF
jgi:hypothetical protein